MRISFSLYILFSFFFIQGITDASAQSRSGFPAPQEDLSSLRRFPCGGTTVLQENFLADSLPQGWQVEDVDGATSRKEIQFLVGQGGWTVVKDFKDTTSGNFVMASPSWYETNVPSNDWLVSPQISNLPANTCLSWYAYSQDQFNPEDYEVWINAVGPTPDDFLNNGSMLDSIVGEGTSFTFRSISLADFAGQDVYIAFRHTSDNKFILALDEIRLAQVEAVDLAIFQIDEIRSKVNDPVLISGSIINRGLDTLRFDSAAFEIFYSIDSEDTNRFAFPRLFSLPPNDTLNWVHDSIWIPEVAKVYRVEIWLSQFAGDLSLDNDSIGFWQGIGIFTSADPLEKASFEVFPNPGRDYLTVKPSQQFPAWDVRLLNVHGQLMVEERIQLKDSHQVSVQSLAPGMYVLQLWAEGKLLGSRKVRVLR